MAIHLGTVTTIVASSPDAARDILQRHDAAFSGRSIPDGTHVFAHNTHSMGWLPASSPRWRALRKVCSGELFVPHRLDMHQSLRQEKLAREGTPVCVGRLGFMTALNLLSSTIFSTELAILDDRHVKPSDFKAMLAELNVTVGLPNLSDFIPEVAWLDLQGLRRRIEGLFTRLHAMIGEQIEHQMRDRAAIAGAPTKKNFLDVLLDYHNFLDDLFSAGTDTSSATVEWAMAELLLNPSCMSRAREELDQVIGSKEHVEESDIGQLKYLQAIVKETFRLHPPAPFLLPHVAERTTQVWPEPEKFMPERFLEKEVDFKAETSSSCPLGPGEGCVRGGCWLLAWFISCSRPCCIALSGGFP
uniref:Cytochrome P450 76C2 n=1 Tax=Aegilops tauschii TaxID=37682 RepID=N1QPZ2_AEGTA